ncbi:MAG: polysaccharide biosynthesis tyrosine autokinase [Thermodesulfobacteriota bacterium]
MRTLTMDENREEQIDLRNYLRVMVKRRWTIISIFALVALSVAVYTFTAVPIYRATARIVIEKENPNLVSIQEVMAVDATGSDYYQTQYKIIESRAVAREVIRRLDLRNSREFFPEPKDDVVSNVKAWIAATLASGKEWVRSLLKTAPEPAGEDAEASAPDFTLVNAFIGRVSVEPIRNSRLVDVSVEAADPKMAAGMANELVRAYIDQSLEAKLVAAKDAVQWLGDRIQEERKKVEAAENALLTYKEKHQIITDFSSDAEKITAQKLAQLNSQVVDAESARVEAETRYKQAMALDDTPDMLDSIPEVLKNDLVQEIKKMEVNLYNRMSELSKKYGKRHPQMLAIESELEDLQKRKVQEVKRVINSLRNQYRLAVAKEESLKKALDKQKNESLDMNKKAVEYGVLQRQAESARQMYEMLIKRFKETSLTEEMKTGNIRIVDRAETPISPVKPKKRLNLLLGLVVGLTLGIGLAFFLEYLDNTIKLPDEVRDYLKIPYLGPIPAFARVKNRDGIPADLVTLHSPKSTASESFRGIRTGILFSSADKAPQVILVSSSGPGEGKTVCASNLAITMAQSGSRVVLLDCDMRRPRLHKVFNISREVGVSNVLVGSTALADALVADVAPNLDVIPCGPIPPNPAEIIGSSKMKELIEALRKTYTRVIIDSPPVTAVTDSVVLAQAADGLIVVIRAGDTPRQIVRNGVTHLKGLNAPILGAVLNGVHTGKDSYYYYQYYYYYYGEDGERRKRFKPDKHT